GIRPVQAVADNVTGGRRYVFRISLIARRPMRPETRAQNLAIDAATAPLQSAGRGSPGPNGGASGPGSGHAGMNEQTATSTSHISASTSIGAHIVGSEPITWGRQVATASCRSLTWAGTVSSSHFRSISVTRGPLLGRHGSA